MLFNSAVSSSAETFLACQLVLRCEIHSERPRGRRLASPQDNFTMLRSLWKLFHHPIYLSRPRDEISE
jgi:hypothetical protein